MWRMVGLIAGLLVDLTLFLLLCWPPVHSVFSRLWESEMASAKTVFCLILTGLDGLLIFWSAALAIRNRAEKMSLAVIRLGLRSLLFVGLVTTIPTIGMAFAIALLSISVAELIEASQAKRINKSEDRSSA